MKQSIVIILMVFFFIISCKKEQKADDKENNTVIANEEVASTFTKAELTAIQKFPDGIKDINGISIFLDWDYNQIVFKSEKNADLNKTFFIYLFDKRNQKSSKNFKWGDKKEYLGNYYLIQKIDGDFENLNKIHVRGWDSAKKLSVWDQYLQPKQFKHLGILDLVEDEWNDENYAFSYDDDNEVFIIKGKDGVNIDLPIFINLFPTDPLELPSEDLKRGYKIDKISLDKNYHYKDYTYFVYEMPKSFSVRKINIRQWNQVKKTAEWDEFIFLD